MYSICTSESSVCMGIESTDEHKFRVTERSPTTRPMDWYASCSFNDIG